MSATHTLLLIDSSIATRQSLSHTLTVKAGDFRLESIARPDQSVARHPDLVIWYIQSARIDSDETLDQLKTLRRRFGETPIVTIADLDDDRLALAAIRHHIRGYVPTSLSMNITIAAIRLVLAGGIFVPEGLITHYMTGASAHEEEAADTAPNSDAELGDMSGLTFRETEVARRIREGKPNKIIAFELRISESTVKVHVRNIMKKLRATNRTQVAFLTNNRISLSSPLASLPAVKAPPHVNAEPILVMPPIEPTLLPDPV
jgi:DNA-binding NarL/FixJ family response regulator